MGSSPTRRLFRSMSLKKARCYWPMFFGSAFAVAWIVARIIVYVVTCDHYSMLSIEEKKLNAVLAQHGDIVLVVPNGRYEDVDTIRSHKRYVTRRRVFWMCKFNDGVITELEQTNLIPLDGEKWRVKVRNDGLTSQIVFDNRIKKPNQREELPWER